MDSISLTTLLKLYTGSGRNFYLFKETFLPQCMPFGQAWCLTFNYCLYDFNNTIDAKTRATSMSSTQDQGSRCHWNFRGNGWRFDFPSNHVIRVTSECQFLQSFWYWNHSPCSLIRIFPPNVQRNKSKGFIKKKIIGFWFCLVIDDVRQTRGVGSCIFALCFFFHLFLSWVLMDIKEEYITETWAYGGSDLCLWRGFMLGILCCTMGRNRCQMCTIRDSLMHDGGFYW